MTGQPWWRLHGDCLTDQTSVSGLHNVVSLSSSSFFYCVTFVRDTDHVSEYEGNANLLFGHMSFLLVIEF